jgi:hypothetical protein
MSRNRAKFTQSDVARILRGAEAVGVEVRMEFRPDGTIIVTKGRAAEGEPIEANPWDELHNGKDRTGPRSDVS